MLKEAEKEYIENPKNIVNPFMIITFTAHDKMKNDAPIGVFIDRSVRVQTVRKEQDQKYHRVIEAFGNKIGTPILINTSFNSSVEAIVENPDQAITDLYLEHLDYLAIGDYLVKRKKSVNILSIDFESWKYGDHSRLNHLTSDERKQLDANYFYDSTFRLLDILDANNTKATFFFVAEGFDWYPE